MDSASFWHSWKPNPQQQGQSLPISRARGWCGWERIPNQVGVALIAKMATWPHGEETPGTAMSASLSVIAQGT
jgi:hypothetical protein